MFDILASVLGPYYYQFIIQGGMVIQLLLAALIFTRPLRRKRLFFPRFLLSALSMVAIMFVAMVIRTDYANVITRIIASLLQYGITLPLLCLCYEGTVFTWLQTWCMSVAASEITGCLYWGLLTASGTDTTTSISFFNMNNPLVFDWTLYWCIQLLLLLGIYRLFGRNLEHEYGPEKFTDMALLSVGSIISQIILSSISDQYRSASFPLYAAARLYRLSMSLMVLIIGSYIIRQHQLRAETALMEQTILGERQQYQRMKENIDIINMRCHDLKHQLANFSGRLTEEEVKSLQEAVNIYDSTVKTGSEVLDVLFYEKQLACQQDGILLTCMADGKALSFMRTRHIYALFDNAVSNAIEAVRQLSDPEMKVISLNVGCKNGVVEIVVTNYFAGSVEFNDGLPSTTKENKNQHGFGSMSIRYIAEQYRGTMKAEAENGIYTLTVRLPVPAAA